MSLIRRSICKIRKAELAEAVAGTANAVIKERDERIAALEAENQILKARLHGKGNS